MDKRLSLEETEKLLKKWREEQDKEAYDTLTIANMGLVGHFAKKYVGRGLSYEELKSAGCEGLINAINKFNYLENDINAFSTYLSVSIYHSMEVEIQKYQKHSHVLSIYQTIAHRKDGDEITIDDTLSTDEVLDEELLDIVKNETIREVIETLTPKEQQVILLRYGFDAPTTKTQKEIANILGCTQQEINRQEHKALKKMRSKQNVSKLKDFVKK